MSINLNTSTTNIGLKVTHARQGTDSAPFLTAGPSIGATTVTVNAVPMGAGANDVWAVIDPWTTECEIRKVTGVSGLSLTVAALSYAHAQDDPVFYIPSPEFNVKWFGAKGGPTDTTALQRTLDAVPAYGKVLVPGAGDTYGISGGLSIADKPGVEIYSDGVALINMTDGTGNILTIDNCPHMKIRNMRFTADGTNAGRGLDVTDSYGLTMENVWVYGAQNDQVHITGSWWVSTRDCVFSCLYADTGYYGFYHDTDSNAVIHERSQFQGREDCLGVYIADGQGIKFHVCDFSGVSTGAAASVGAAIGNCRGVTFDTCYFEFNGLYAIHIGDDSGGSPINIRIVGCYFNQNDIEDNIAIYVHHNASYVTIDDNHFLGNSASGVIGIKIDEDAVLHGIEIGYKNDFINIATPISDPKFRADYNHDRRLSHDTQAPQNGLLYRKGDIVFNMDGDDGERLGWMATLDNNYAVKGGWVTGTAYTAGDYVGYGTNIYKATNSATSGATAPTHTSGDVSDGAVTWRFIKSSAPFSSANMRGFGQINYRSGTGSPVGVVTPNFIQELWYRTDGPPYLYMAYYTGNTHWRILDNY